MDPLPSPGFTFKLPPQDVVDRVDAPKPPLVRLSPKADVALLVHLQAHVPLAVMAEPFISLAGVRIIEQRGACQHLSYGTGLTLLRLPSGQACELALAPESRIGMPQFAPDGSTFAFTRDAHDRTELWTGDSRSGALRCHPDIRVNDVISEQPFVFSADGLSLWVLSIPPGRGAPPPRPKVPVGPSVQETSGKKTPVATYQDLLGNAYDEALFTHFGSAQLLRVNLTDGSSTPVGLPAMFDTIAPSPDGLFLLVTEVCRPFSYRIGLWGFPQTAAIWSSDGAHIRHLADLPLADETPRHGVRKGPRALRWQPAEGARLFWVEALDEGDPTRQVPHRDAMWELAAPFSDAPQCVGKLPQRLTSVLWLSTPGQALVTQLDRERRWSTTSRIDLRRPAEEPSVLFDLSVRDAYADPGNFLTGPRTGQSRSVLQDGQTAWLVGEGASEQGARPFLDSIDLGNGTTQRLFRSADDALERVIGFLQDSRTQVLVQRETATQAPSLWRIDLATGSRQRLTDGHSFRPALAGVTKQTVRYMRGDQVPLSGTLYLPAETPPGTRLPLLIWAYPQDHSDAGTGGQVRTSPNTYVRPLGASPLYFACQGWAVLMDAAMPVVGSTQTMNDSFVEQIAASARAAIEALDASGQIDPQRVVIAGHSYGAFMAANLLAHTDLFAAGIARNGAYNRTLTPFGFQQERRTYWQATETYTRLSPFTFAHRITAPLLLIHGEVDNNPGTHPLQSERLYGAIGGNGGTARLVMLPHEGHTYKARESILHALAEMLEWGRRWTHPSGAAAVHET